MALIVKRISDIFTEVKDSLQDQQGTRWTEQELYRYLDQGMRNIALATKYNLIKHEIAVGDKTASPFVDTYTLPLEAIEFYSIHSKDKTAETTQSNEIIDARTIRFPENKREDVVVEYYAFPNRVVYGTVVELELDEDLYDALYMFILYRAYQKEASTENLAKAGYFNGEYRTQLSLNMTRWHGKYEVTSSRTAFLR